MSKLHHSKKRDKKEQLVAFNFGLNYSDSSLGIPISAWPFPYHQAQPTNSLSLSSDSDQGFLFWFNMTRGNQRERDRERAAARNSKDKKKEDGLTPEQRRERDAKALQEKAAKKAAQAEGKSGGNSSKK